MEANQETELSLHLWEKPDCVTLDGKLGERLIEVHIFKRSVRFIVDGKSHKRIRQNSSKFIAKVQQRNIDSLYVKAILNLGRNKGYL